MASATVYFGSSGANTKQGSTAAVAADGYSKKVTGLSLDYLNNGAYLANYTYHSGGGIYFYINGTHVMTAPYNGSNARPATSWSGSLIIPAWTAITLSFSSDNTSTNRAMRNQFALHVTYENLASHPTVTAGNPIKASDMEKLYYFKNGTTASPGQGITIIPWIIGSRGTRIDASTYNNA